MLSDLVRYSDQKRGDCVQARTFELAQAVGYLFVAIRILVAVFAPPFEFGQNLGQKGRAAESGGFPDGADRMNGKDGALAADLTYTDAKAKSN